MKVLVTGGAGFIGSHVSRLLLDTGHDVNILDNLQTGSRSSLDERANFIEGDISNKDKAEIALKKVDAVIHMAGLIVVPESVKNPVLYCKNNVNKTVSFLESMRKQEIKKIVFSSSACVYGSPEKLPITETAPLKPDNPYGASKASIEAFLQSYSTVYGFDSIVLRYFNPYGPGELHKPETHAIPNFIKSTLVKKPIPLYWQGKQIRDFIYVEDLAQAHIDVLNLKGYQVFNIGSEVGVSIKSVIDKIFKIIGYKVEIQDLGKREGDVQANYASSDKIYKTVGWKPKVDIEDGLKKTINFYKSF